jgi:hypothetical protein
MPATINYLRAEFLNPQLESEMCENGFVHIPSFLSQETIQQLYDLYASFHTEINPEKGMWNSMYDVGTENAAYISV